MKRLLQRFQDIDKNYVVILFFLVIVLHAFLLFLPPSTFMRWYFTDDAFYYFQVARNITTGNGISFDGITLASGFHPLWMLVCIPIFTLAQINLFLPLKILLVISVLLTYFGGLLLYKMIRSLYSPPFAILGSIIWVFYWPVHQTVTQSGMEAGLNGFLIISLLYVSAITRSKPAAFRNMLKLGLLAGLVLLSRLDNIFLVFFFGLWLIFQNPRMRFLVLADVLSIFFSVLISLIFRVGTVSALTYIKGAYLIIAVSIIIRLLIHLFAGLYDPPETHTRTSFLIRCMASAAVSFLLIFSAVTLFLQLGLIDGFPRAVLLIDSAIMLLSIMLSRIIPHAGRKERVQPDLMPRNLWRIWLQRGIAFFLPVILLFSAYIVWHWMTFDTAMPVSGQIKQWWGTLPNTIYGQPHQTLGSVLGLQSSFCRTHSSSDPWSLAFSTFLAPFDWVNSLLPGKVTNACSPLIFPLLLLYAGCFFWLIRKQAAAFKKAVEQFSLPALFAVGLFQPFFYNASGYLHTREWYWLAQILVTILITIILLACLMEIIKNHIAGSKVFTTALFLSSALILVSFSVNMIKVFPIGQTGSEIVDPSVPFLENNTEPGAHIGITGGGITAYFITDRTIVNLDGLMNSTEYFASMKSGNTTQFYGEIGLDYVYGNEVVLLDSDPYRWFFTGRLNALSSIDNETLYEYISDN